MADDASFRLITATDAASRHLYFTYASPTSFLVTGVSSDFGVSLTYSYDTQGRLIKVTKPDSTTVSFQYDSNSFISAVLDNNGKVLESHVFHIVLDEYNQWKDLEMAGRKHGRSPRDEFCHRMEEAGNPPYYMTSIGPMPNPCNSGGEI